MEGHALDQGVDASHEVSGWAHTIVIRTRRERFLGDFVLHCHILDHEGKGMM
jgi:FtsP/CotA-like multicopper oxidase with cupredoxin domain